MSQIANESDPAGTRLGRLAGFGWPVLVAAGAALVFAGHLLTTPDPFLGSGTDIVAIEYPQQAFAAAKLGASDLPLWNPYHLGGAPFQTGVHGYLSPSFWLTALVPPLLAMKLAIVLHLMLAAAGGAWLARLKTGSALAAVLAGIAFAFSGFVVSHLFAGHPRLVFTAAYLPWVVGLLDRAVQQRPRGMLLAGVVCGLMILCGHYHVVFIGLCGAGLFIVLNQLQPSERVRFTQRAARAVVIMAVVVAIGALLAMVQLLPTAEALQSSQRSGGGPAFASRYASAPINLLTLVWPNLFGNFVEAPFFGSWAYWEALPYVGLVPLVLLVASPMVLPWRQWLPAGAVMLLGLVLSMGAATPVFEVFARVVPGAGMFRGAGRYVLLTALFGSLLAARVLARWLADPGVLSGRRLGVLLILPAIAVGFGAWVSSQSDTSWQQTWEATSRRAEIPAEMSSIDWANALDLAKDDAVRAVSIMTAAVALLWGAGRFGFRRWAAAALVVLAFVDLYGFAHRFLSTGDRSLVTWPKELGTFLEQNHEPGLRIIDDPALLCPARGAAVGVGHVGGDDIFVDEAYARYMNTANGKDPNLFVSYIRTFENTPMHQRLGAKYLLSAAPLGEVTSSLAGFGDWAPETRFGRIWVYRDPAPQPRAFLVHSVEVVDEAIAFVRMADPSFDLRGTLLVEQPLPPEFEMTLPAINDGVESARIAAYQSDRVEIEVDASSAGALVLSDNWSAGWRAWVDGEPKPVVRADRVMRAVPVPSGRHLVVLEYRPATLILGASVSLLSLAGLGARGAWRRSRKQAEG